MASPFVKHVSEKSNGTTDEVMDGYCFEGRKKVVRVFQKDI